MPDTPYGQFLDRVPDGFLLFDEQGCLLDANAHACASLGHHKAAMLGLGIMDVWPDADGLRRGPWQDMAVDSQAHLCGRLIRRDGASFPAELHIYCQSLSGRRLFFTTWHELSERTGQDEPIGQPDAQLEPLLRKSTGPWQDSTRLLEAVMHETPDLVFAKDRQGRYTFVNPAAARFSGRTPEDIVGKTDQELFPDSSFTHSDRRVLDSDAPVVSEDHLLVNGQRRLFQSTKIPYRNDEGRTVGVLGIARDITLMRQTESQLQKSYDVLRQAEQLARLGSWTWELDTEHFQASEMMYVMNGLDPQGPPLTRHALRAMLGPQDLARLTAAVQLCIGTGQSYSLDVVHHCPDGRRFAARLMGRALRDEQGRIVALSGTLQDLSEREDARMRLEALADNLPSGAIYRLEGGLAQLRLSYISAGIENLIGVPAHAIMADRQAYLNAIHPEDLPHYQQMLQCSVDTLRVFDCRFRVIRPDGEVRWLRCRSAPRSSHEGMVWDGIMLDITREREAEQALQQAKEAAEAAERAKSDFLAIMSHEIRTPMNTVIGMTRLVQQTALTSRQRGYLEKVERSASALLAVINDVLDFSKIEAGMLALEEVDFALDDVLETVSASTALRAEEKGLEVVYALDPHLPPRLRGDPLRLGQVLTNLVGNAIKFTE
ncbi:PAS domain-containing protein, partial [Delftia tsuruhatensis]